MKKVNFVIMYYRLEKEEIEYFKSYSRTQYRKIETPCKINMYFEKTIHLKTEMYKKINDSLSQFLTMPATKQTAEYIRCSLMSTFDMAINMNDLFFEDEIFDNEKYNCVINAEPLYDIYKKESA